MSAASCQMGWKEIIPHGDENPDVRGGAGDRGAEDVRVTLVQVVLTVCL